VAHLSFCAAFQSVLAVVAPEAQQKLAGVESARGGRNHRNRSPMIPPGRWRRKATHPRPAGRMFVWDVIRWLRSFLLTTG